MNRDRRSVEIAQEIGWAMQCNARNLPDHLIGMTELGPVSKYTNQIDMSNTATAVVANRWKRGSKAVISVDDDLLAEIVDAMSEEMPGDVFKRIPYESPLIVFPEPLTLSGSDGNDQDVMGFFVYATDNVTAERYEHMDTADPDIGKIGMMFVSRIKQPSGPPMYDYSRVRVVLKEKFHVKDAILETAMQHMSSSRIEGATPNDQLSWIGAIVGLGLNTLVYLCGPDPDLEVQPPHIFKRFRKSLKSSFLPRTVPIYRVGWRIGPALVAARNQYIRTLADNTGKGQPQGPQHRRGCFRTYWVGKGRKTAVVRFVAPYWTHKELMHLAPNTVHRAI